MNQRSFFDADFQADLARKRNADTSAAALESIAPIRNGDSKRVLAAIKEHGGLTCDECENILGMKHQTCSARFRDLALSGHIVKAGEKRKTLSGRKAEVWRATKP